MSTFTTRGPYQGVLQILQFNRRMYLIATAGIVAAGLAWRLSLRKTAARFVGR